MDKLIIWCAGFLDGEGTITIKRNQRKDARFHVNYQPQMSCGQTVKGEVAIKRLQELFGGSLYYYKQKGQREDTVQWSIVNQDVKKCLEKITPYLILKRRQAEILIEFLNTEWTREKGYKLTRESWEKRENFFQRIREFNVKGRIRLQRLNEKTPKGDVIV